MHSDMYVSEICMSSVARKQGHHHVLIIWNMLSLGQYIYMSL